MKLVTSFEFPMKLLILMVAATITLASQDGIDANGVCLSEERYKNISKAITEEKLVEMKKEFSDLKGLVVSLTETVALLTNRISLLDTCKSVTDNTTIQGELFNAARDDDLSLLKAAITQLGNSGLDLNWRNPDHNGYTALLVATEKKHPSIAILTALLEAGANPNVQSNSGWTPVYLAAGYKNNTSVLRLLLDDKYKADVNLPANDGITPVYYAARLGRPGALELLLAHGGDPNKPDNVGNSPLMLASTNWYVDAVRFLIQAGAQVNYVRPHDGYTALHQAAENNREDIARVLLQLGADKNKRNNKGWTPAETARQYWNDSVAQLIDEY